MEQEYIKGDIVMYDNKIHTIMDTLGVNNYELSYVEHPVHQLELSGVLVTPEILEKNGWEKDEEASFKTQLYYRKKSISKFIVIIIRKDCYDCLGCSHLVAASVNSTHNVSIECDIDNEDIEL